MSEFVFFDTNILLYVYDRRSPEKRARAAALLAKHGQDRTLAISTQVAQEFYVSATTKLSLPAAEAKLLLIDLLELNVIAIERTRIMRALDFQSKYQISFWDALILSAAEGSGARLLYSEDFSTGQSYDGIKVINPFLEQRR